MATSRFLGCFLVVTLLAGFSSAALSQVVVDIPDPNLEAAFRDAIPKPTGPIYDTDLEALTDRSSTPDESRIDDDLLAAGVPVRIADAEAALEVARARMSAAAAWGRANLVDPGETRKAYVRALQAADAGDIAPLIEFARS